MSQPIDNSAFDALPGPYSAQPSPNGIQASPAVLQLVRSQVQALLQSSPAFLSLPEEQRKEMAHNLVKIAAYSAALVQDDWAQSRKLGQTPMLRQTVLAPLAGATAGLQRERAPEAEEFSPRAVNQVARLTRETLNAVSFPTFVADLIKGSYMAIVDASIKQMEAYAQLLANVAMTVDQFMASNITDNQARDYLADRYPEHIRVDTSEDRPILKVRERDDEGPGPDFKSEFGLNEDLELSDETVEATLLPAARRKLAQQRHQVLSMMVMMGINRIVVTSGRIKAGMQFHIDAHDSARAEKASEYDFKHTSTAAAGGVLGGFFGGGFTSTTSVAYVTTSKKDSTDSINLTTDLTGEVEIKFKTDYLPMERFANPQMIALIQGHTPNPQANRPTNPGSEKNQASPAGA